MNSRPIAVRTSFAFCLGLAVFSAIDFHHPRAWASEEEQKLAEKEVLAPNLSDSPVTPQPTSQTEKPRERSSTWDRPLALMLYGGLGSPTPLPSILRVRELDLTLDGILALGAQYRVLTDRNYVSLEAETTIAQHLEELGRLSFGFAAVVRFHRPPWRVWFDSTFAVGNGLSYATTPPEIEIRTLPRTSRWFYHLVFELTFNLKNHPEWETLFRIHHRSGIFGIFDGVTGGSDFICLGIRYRI